MTVSPMASQAGPPRAGRTPTSGGRALLASEVIRAMQLEGSPCLMHGLCCSEAGRPSFCCPPSPPSHFIRCFNRDERGCQQNGGLADGYLRLLARRPTTTRPGPRLAVGATCHFAGPSFPSTLKHLLKGEGGAAEWQSRQRLDAAPSRAVQLRPSRRRDCHFDGTPCCIPIETPTKGTGGAIE